MSDTSKTFAKTRYRDLLLTHHQSEVARRASVTAKVEATPEMKALKADPAFKRVNAKLVADAKRWAAHRERMFGGKLWDDLTPEQKSLENRITNVEHRQRLKLLAARQKLMDDYGVTALLVAAEAEQPKAAPTKPNNAAPDGRLPASWFFDQYEINPDTLRKAREAGRLKKCDKRVGRWFYDDAEVRIIFAAAVADASRKRKA